MLWEWLMVRGWKSFEANARKSPISVNVLAMVGMAPGVRLMGSYQTWVQQPLYMSSAKERFRTKTQIVRGHLFRKVQRWKK